MTDPVVSADGLGRRFRRRGWALADVTLDLPAAGVVGLVGPNGAGKSTLLGLIAGTLAPTAGTITVCGGRPGSGAAQLAKVGFVAQDAPVYANLTVADHLALGARLNPGWDAALASDRVTHLGLDPAQKAGRLSGGQRAQLALTLGIAKRPELLVLDEPVASLDPLARREFLGDLMALVAEHGLTVLLSSHLVADLERTCDHIVLLTGGRVQLSGAIDDLVATHHRVTGPSGAGLPGVAPERIVAVSTTERQRTQIVRGDLPALHPPDWTFSALDLEDLLLAYMSQSSPSAATPRKAVAA